MENSTLPEDFVDVWVTFLHPISQVPTTMRGFYSNLFENFAIPPEYRMFNGKLLPHGFGGFHLIPENIIRWEPINQEVYEHLAH